MPVFFSCSLLIYEEDVGYMYNQRLHVQSKVTCTIKGYMYNQRFQVQSKVTCTIKGYMYNQIAEYWLSEPTECIAVSKWKQ